MSRLLLTISTVLLFGCTMVATKETDLFEIYKELAKEVSNSSVVANREKYFSNFYLSDVTENNEKSTFVLKIPGQIRELISHFQAIQSKEIACLTINGLDVEGYPASINIEYTYENGAWLVNYMHLNLLESQSSFTNEAVCPRELG